MKTCIVSSTPWRPLLVALLLAACAAPAVEASVTPAVGDTLSADAAKGRGLLVDVVGLQRVVFFEAPWGGYLAHYETLTATGLVWRERSIPAALWRGELSHRPTADDSTAAPPRLRVWPETALPADTGSSRPRLKANQAPPDIDGRWLMMFGGGLKHPASDFDTYFTTMGLLGMTVGKNLGFVTPEIGFEAGFGDIPNDFEDWFQDGRSFFYAITLGLKTSHDIGRHRSLYVAAKTGYFMRSLQWGATFQDPVTGYWWDENLVIEQQDWGLGLRAGVQLLLGDARKTRLVDIGFEVQTFESERWHYWSEEDGVDFDAHGRDWWLTLSVNIGEAL